MLMVTELTAAKVNAKKAFNWAEPDSDSSSSAVAFPALSSASFELDLRPSFFGLCVVVVVGALLAVLLSTHFILSAPGRLVIELILMSELGEFHRTY